MKLITFKLENGINIRRDYELLENGEIKLVEMNVENGYDNDDVSDTRKIYVYNENTSNTCNLEDMLDNF